MTPPDPFELATTAAKMLFKADDVIELRILGTINGSGVMSGYFNNFDALASAAAEANKAKGIYVVLNPVNPALLARAANHLRVVRKEPLTTDADVLERRWLLVDIDPIRPSGISATDAEHNLALAKARLIYDTLAKDGWPRPALVDSGNGAHLLYPIQLPNNPESTDLVRQALAALAFRFDDSSVTVDTGVYNASRLTKLPGTVARKGDNLPERPHRTATVLSVPNLLTVVEPARLFALAATLPPLSPIDSTHHCTSFNLEQWIAKYEILVEGPQPWKGGHKWILPVCPWNAEHSRTAYIVRLENGALQAGCHHKSCGGKDWHALRDLHEPGWRRSSNGANDQTKHLTDVGNSQRLAARHGQDLRFCHMWKVWMVWTGTSWREDSTGEVERRAKETALSIYGEIAAEPDADKRKAISRWAQSSESHKRIVAMIDLAKSEIGISASPAQFDVDPFLLNCGNGMLDLRTGELRGHRREDFCTKQVACDYLAEAACPAWLTFLDDIMAGNIKMIEFLQRAVGYALSGSTREQVMFIEYGNGSNGKGTFNETLKALLGNYAQSADSSLLTVRKNESVRSDVARLAGARFVCTSETEAGKRLAEALIKQMTGDDTIVARHLYQNEFEYIPQCKIFLGTNHKPVIKGTDLGIWRRIRLVPFQVTIPEPKRDKHLKEKLRAEFSGILAWAVRGFSGWQRYGLQPPREITAATEYYRQEMDVVSEFTTEMCIVTPGVKTSAKALYEAYRAFCGRNGEEPVRQFDFGGELTARGLERRHGRLGWSWHGIALVAVTHGDPDAATSTHTPVI